MTNITYGNWSQSESQLWLISRNNTFYEVKLCKGQRKLDIQDVKT